MSPVGGRESLAPAGAGAHDGQPNCRAFVEQPSQTGARQEARRDAGAGELGGQDTARGVLEQFRVVGCYLGTQVFLSGVKPPA